jgi:hypothetical protein
LFFQHLIWLNLVSVGSHLLSKLRNRLDAVQRGDVGLSLAALQPGVQNLQVFIRLKEHAEYTPVVCRILSIV